MSILVVAEHDNSSVKASALVAIAAAQAIGGDIEVLIAGAGCAAAGETAAKVAGKTIDKKHIDGPLGVRGRNSNNDLIREKLGWDYEQTLEEGIRKTYEWVKWQVIREPFNEEPTIREYELTAAG